MLLRRVMEHVKAQNWTAVALDFVIVVMGVFIGIQVNNWNEARKDHAAEQRYLVRLHDDIAHNFDISKRLAEGHAHRAATLKMLWEYAEGMRADPPDENSMNSICRWFILPAIRIRSSTYQELVSTGNLTLIRNEEIRWLVQSAYAEHESTRRQIDLFGDKIRNLAEKIARDFEWRLRPAGKLQNAADAGNPAPNVICNVNVAPLLKNPNAPSVLAQLYRARVISDLKTDIVELEKRKTFWSAAAAEGRIALAYAEEGRLPEEGAWGVLRALLHASQVWRFIFNQTTYLEMQSAGDLRLIGDTQLRSDLAYYYVTVAERRGDGMYQSLPEYRETVRSLVPSRISQYYWRACHEQPPGEQRLKPCPSPMEDAEAAAVLEAVIGHTELVSELRFWVDTLEVLDRLVVDDLQIAENLINQLTESAP